MVSDAVLNIAVELCSWACFQSYVNTAILV